jgi:hypothetical protein
MSSQYDRNVIKIEVAKLSLQGYNAVEIGKKIGLSRTQTRRYLAQIEGEWKEIYSVAYDDLKVRKLAELNNIKKTAHLALEACGAVSDYSNVSKFITNIVKIIDTELSTFGINKKEDSDIPKPLRDFIDAIREMGCENEFEMQDFVDYLGSKYKKN